MINAQAVDVESANEKVPVGTRFINERTGKIYYYCKAKEPLAKGAVLTSMLILDGTFGACSGKDFKSNGTDLLATQVGAWVKVNSGGKSETDAPNKITSFKTTTWMTVENDWSETMTTSEGFILYHPFWVEEATDTDRRILGVAPIAVTSGYYFFAQMGGYCEHVKVDGSALALVAHEGIISSAAAGVATGLTGTTDVDEAEKSNIICLFPSAIVQTVPALLNCLP